MSSGKERYLTLLVQAWGVPCTSEFSSASSPSVGASSTSGGLPLSLCLVRRTPLCLRDTGMTPTAFFHHEPMRKRQISPTKRDNRISSCQTFLNKPEFAHQNLPGALDLRDGDCDAREAVRSACQSQLSNMNTISSAEFSGWYVLCFYTTVQYL